MNVTIQSNEVTFALPVTVTVTGRVFVSVTVTVISYKNFVTVKALLVPRYGGSQWRVQKTRRERCMKLRAQHSPI